LKEALVTVMHRKNQRPQNYPLRFFVAFQLVSRIAYSLAGLLADEISINKSDPDGCFVLKQELLMIK
jgi:hypothetical protein